MTAHDGSSLLVVDDVSIGYETHSGAFGRRSITPVVERVSFDIRPGETLGFVGESGSGKSTVGKAILRLLPVLHGQIRYDGRDIAEGGGKVPLSYRQQVQAVFQDPAASLNPRYLVSDAVELPLRRHGVNSRSERRARVREAFEMVGLSADHLQRFPNELSGGQQQRVAIARALVLKPRLIVCDEAVSALDLSTQGQIINLLSELQEVTGISYLFIAHDLGLVRHIAHRVGVMSGGRLVELADTAELFGAPRDTYTQRLLEATPASTPEGREARRTRRLEDRLAGSSR